MDDRQLLRLYCEQGSESAFRTFVERHLPLVHSVAMRQVRDPHLAEEVSQAVFLLLSRKARIVANHPVPGGWLHRTTCFVAARAARADQRRRQREQEAFAMQESTQTESSRREILPLIDEALASLGETDRNAVVLRFLDHRSFREVGAALGVGEEAARKRVDRALDRIRTQMLRHGLAVSVAALAAMISDHEVQAAPAHLANRILESVRVQDAVTTAGGMALPSLVRETLASWRHAQWKAGLGWSALVGIASLLAVVAYNNGTGFWTRSSAVASPSSGATVAVPQVGDKASSSRSPGAPSEAGATTHRNDSNTLYLYVVDEATGKGIPDAAVARTTVINDEWFQRQDLRTDSNGVVAVPYPQTTGRLDVGIVSDGWAARYATFRPHQEDPIPDEYRLVVPKAARPIGGILRDGQGSPIPDADIIISFQSGGDYSERETPRERFGAPVWDAVVARTDSDGRWKASILPDKHPGFGLKARHPAFAPASIISIDAGVAPHPGEATPSNSSQQLWAGNLVTTVDPAVVLAGLVVDEGERPIAGARVVHSPSSSDERIVITDEEGKFQIQGLPAERFDFTVVATGYAPEYRDIAVTRNSIPIEVRLPRGSRLQVRVVDEQDEGVANVEVGVEQWNEVRHKLDWRGTTGSDGTLVWDSAPPGARLELFARKQGWCYTRDVWVNVENTEHVIRLRPALSLTTRARDADSGRPLAEFNLIPGYGESEHCWYRGDTRHARSGEGLVHFTENRLPWRVRIEAAGYEPFISEPLDPARTAPLEADLRLLDSRHSISGMVRLPDGQPAAGADVGLLTVEHDVRVGRFALMPPEADPWMTRTDSEGRFTFPPNRLAHSVVAGDLRGFDKVRLSENLQETTLTLRPWGRVEGTIDPTARRRPVETVWLCDPAALEYRGRIQFGGGFEIVRPDVDGHFAFESVPPGTWIVWISSGAGIAFHHKTQVEVQPGDITQVILASQGPTVRGRLLLPPREAASNPSTRITSLDPAAPPPRREGFQGTLAAVDYWQSEPGRAWAFRGVNVGLKLASNGSFTTEEEFPPGEYLIEVWLPDGKVSRVVTVPVPAEGESQIDLGDIAVDPGTNSTRASVP